MGKTHKARGPWSTVCTVQLKVILGSGLVHPRAFQTIDKRMKLLLDVVGPDRKRMKLLLDVVDPDRPEEMLADEPRRSEKTTLWKV